jgi:hypothetical protein
MLSGIFQSHTSVKGRSYASLESFQAVQATSEAVIASAADGEVHLERFDAQRGGHSARC